MNSDIRFYWSLLLRRLPVMLVLFLLSAGIGVGLALTLPPKFRASAQLLVESPQIPQDMAASTVMTAATEQLQVIEQRLTTRATLIDLANRFDLFDDRGRMNPDEIVERMRRLVEIDWSGGRDQATLMTISFESENARQTAAVVNELVTRVLNEDVRFRTARAEETLEFFEEEVDRLSIDLAGHSADIVEFKSANKDALPDGQTYRLTRQGQLQDAINLALRDRAALNEQRNRLVEMYEATGTLNRPTAQLTPAEQELEATRRELNNALSIYSDSNPRVKILRAKVERLEAQLNASVQTGDDDAGDGGGEGEKADTLLDLQLAEIDARIASIDDIVSKNRDELEGLTLAIRKTPENAIRLEALEREYENVQNQYNAAVVRLAQAQTGERIEVLSKGARMTVIEQATVPTEPTSPNRKLIAATGIGFGGALAVGFFILMELVNRAVRRPADLVKALNIQPLATVPYLETAAARHRRRAMQTIAASVLVLGTPALLWAVHEYYAPLDYVFTRVLDKLGV